MRYLTISNVLALGLILGMSSMALAQATTGATPEYNPGPTLPLIDGHLQYSLFASEVAQTGYFNTVTSTTNLGGSLEYLTKSTESPFSLLYSGAYLYETQQGIGSSTFQALTASQGLIRGGWVLGVTDSVSYLPNSPSAGIYGVPGAGGIGLQPITGGTIPSQTVLTYFSQRVSNSVSGNVERSINRRTSITGIGSYGILRFLDNSGEDSSQLLGSLSLNRLLDARNTLSANATYQTYSFSGFYTSQPSINTRGLNVVYDRIWTRALSTSLSAGPQWISGYTLTPLQLLAYPPGTNPVVPGRLTYSIGASATYIHRFTQGTLTYSHGVNGGSGVQPGATADTFNGQISSGFGPNWQAGLSAGIAHTDGLAGSSSTLTFNTGAQLTRRITQHLSGFISDSVQQQSSSGLVGTNAFNGISNSAAIGITYAPRSTRLGQF